MDGKEPGIRQRDIDFRNSLTMGYESDQPRKLSVRDCTLTTLLYLSNYHENWLIRGL